MVPNLFTVMNSIEKGELKLFILHNLKTRKTFCHFLNVETLIK